MNTHFNHPSELTPAAVAASDRLSRAGISLGCQTVLLKGVNDDPKIMMKLMHELLKARVRPYYIYMADQVAGGGEHFRTTVQKGLEIIQALRGWTSGLAVPQFVIDSPGGGGKVPLLPEYVESITDDEVVFRNYQVSGTRTSKAGRVRRFRRRMSSGRPSWMWSRSGGRRRRRRSREDTNAAAEESRGRVAQSQTVESDRLKGRSFLLLLALFPFGLELL